MRTRGKSMNEAPTGAYSSARPVPRLLRVAETQLARLAADGDEASAKTLWRYVERDMAR
jgi:hypothetical protein